MDVTTWIPDHLRAEFEQRAGERYGEEGPGRALQEAVALWLEMVAEQDGLKRERLWRMRCHPFVTWICT